MRILLLGALLGAFAAPRDARACAACACGDPTLTAMGVEKPYKNRVRIGLDEFFGSASTGQGDSLETVRTLRSTLTFAWSITPRITVGAALPVLVSWVLTPTAPTDTIAGLGDGELYGRFVVWRDRSFSPRHLVSLLGGLKLPTGPRVGGSQGYPVDDDLQPGSGSWDPFVGATYGHFNDGFALFASVSYRYTTPGWHGLVRGMSLGGSLGGQLQPFGWGALALSLDARWSDADRAPGGVVVPDTGGAMLALTPSLLVTPTTNWLIRLAVQIHVADWLNGVQSQSTSLFLSTVVDLN